jgi:phospholipid/cholesterol/gamma-HCH transport system substrate-binding protein
VVDDKRRASYHAAMRVITRLFTVITLVAVAALLVVGVRSRIQDVSVGENLRTYVLLRDGSRVAPSSPVVIAGVRVGDIERVSLEGNLARIDLRLRDDIRIPRSSVATRRADKLFGDSYIEIIPGSDPDGPTLRSGERILYALEGSSADTILRGIDSALPKADRAMQLTQDAATASRQWVAGPMDNALARAQSWLDEGNIEAPIARLDRAITTIDDGTERAARALAGAQPEVFATLDRIDDALLRGRAGMASANQSITGIAAATEARLAELEPELTDLATALREVDEPAGAADASGEVQQGTLARLINDRELSEDLDDAVESGAGAVRDLNRFHVLLGLRSEYNVFARAQRVIVEADVSAHSDSFYHVEVEFGPQGRRPEVALRNEGGDARYVRTVDLSAGSTFTAQWGKRFGPLSLRGGIKSSTVGIGADLRFRDRLRLSADLFGGSYSDAPNLKLAGAFAIFRSLYVLAGVENLLTSPDTLPIRPGGPPVPTTLDHLRYGRDYFFGASVHFTEDDLAMLLRVYGALLVGLL